MPVKRSTPTLEDWFDAIRDNPITDYLDRARLDAEHERILGRKTPQMGVQRDTLRGTKHNTDAEK